MTKINGFLRLVLAFVIITAIIYFGLEYFGVYDETSSGFEGVVESIVYLIIWGTIFAFYFIYSITKKFHSESQTPGIKKGRALSISITITLILLAVVIVGIYLSL